MRLAPESVEPKGYYCSGNALSELRRVILCIGNVLGNVAIDEKTGEKPKLSNSTGTTRGPGKPKKGDVVLPKTMAQVLKEGKAREAREVAAKDVTEGDCEVGTSTASGSADGAALSASLTESMGSSKGKKRKRMSWPKRRGARRDQSQGEGRLLGRTGHTALREQDHNRL